MPQPEKNFRAGLHVAQKKEIWILGNRLASVILIWIHALPKFIRNILLILLEASNKYLRYAKKLRKEICFKSLSWTNSNKFCISNSEIVHVFESNFYSLNFQKRLQFHYIVIIFLKYSLNFNSLILKLKYKMIDRQNHELCNA